MIKMVDDFMYEFGIVIGELYMFGGSVFKVLEEMLFFYNLLLVGINR